MKKKLLTSLVAMLAVFGLAFASTGFDAKAWWSTYGTTLKTSASSLTKENITAQKYADIRDAVAAFKLLDSDDVSAVATSSVAGNAYNTSAKLTTQVTNLESKNTSAATSAVNALKDQISGMTPSEKKYADKADLSESQTKLTQWGAVKADFASFAAAYDGLVAKVTEALQYVTADEWVAKVNGYGFDATKFGTQKTIVEGYKTEGQALDKQTDEVKAALAKIEGWFEEYDRAAYYAALNDLSVLNYNYTLTQEDVDESAVASNYVTLTNLKNAWYYLTNNNSADKSTWKSAAAGIRESEISVTKDMLVEWQAMTDAIEYLQDKGHLYYGASAPTKLYVTGYELEKNDYAKIMQVKAALAEDATTAGKKYINQLFTEDKIETLYTLAKKAFVTYDTNQFIAEAVAKFKEDYATILEATYEATAADYEATAEGKTTVRDAINEFKNEVKAWNVASTYRNIENGGNAVASETAWEITTSAKKSIGTKAYNSLNTSTYPALQALIKSAAEKKIVKDLLAELNTIYTANYVDPSAEAYDEDAVKALKDAKTAKTNANTSAGNIGVRTVVANEATNTYATTNIQNWMWDATNNVIAECATLDDTQNYTGSGSACTKVSECWGYDLVVNNFRKTDEYLLTQKPILQAMVTASTFLTNYASVIWPEGVVTSELATKAKSAKTAYDDYKTKAKSTVQATAALNTAIVNYLAPIEEDTYANIAEATEDLDAITGTITLYQGNSTAVTLESNAATDPEQAKCYTSKKALADKIAEVPNTIAYIAQEITGELPTNVACWADNGGSTWRATDIQLTDGQPFYFKNKITAEKATLHKVFTEYYRPLFCPFDINAKELGAMLKAGFKVRYLDGVVENQKEGEDESAVTMFFKNKKVGDMLYGLKPYIIKAPAEAQGDEGYDIEVANTTVAAVAATEGNVVSTTTEATYTLYGTSKTTTIKSMTDYMMSKKGGFVQLSNNEDGTSQTFGLYAGAIRLNIKGKTGIKYIIRHNYDVEDDEATGINSVETEQVVEGIYTISGQKVENMNKSGLYIVNGKKIMVK